MILKTAPLFATAALAQTSVQATSMHGGEGIRFNSSIPDGIVASDLLTSEEIAAYGLGIENKETSKGNSSFIFCLEQRFILSDLLTLKGGSTFGHRAIIDVASPIGTVASGKDNGLSSTLGAFSTPTNGKTSFGTSKTKLSERVASSKRFLYSEISSTVFKQNGGLTIHPLAIFRTFNYSFSTVSLNNKVEHIAKAGYMA